jgi:predicted DCC family thiol-disulfide oxidoreductase YuxK
MAAIILFDGVCNFCNGTVNFIIVRDRAGYYKFAPMQSEIGQELRAKCGVSDDVDSIILIENETAYIYSTAALRIARRLGGIWPILYPLIAVPKPIRDFFYKLFARNRYRLFGKKDVCMVPTPEVRERFL